MNRFTMLVGLPASGKSTYADKIKRIEGDNCEIVSSDKMRIALFGDVNHQTSNDIIFNTMKEVSKVHLINGNHVIYDATNLTSKNRIATLDELKKYSEFMDCIIFATPIDMCIKFDKSRERVVSETVINRMVKTFNVPMFEEGFDHILIIPPDLSSMEEEFASQELHNLMMATSQDNPHHPNLTIGQHCEASMEILRRDNPNYTNIIKYATKYHDYGKLFCKEYNPEKGHFVYYSHHNYGAYLFLSYIRNFDHMEFFNAKDLLEIAFLIENHMLPFFIEEGSKSHQKFIKRYGQNRWDDILMIHNADILAK